MPVVKDSAAARSAVLAAGAAWCEAGGRKSNWLLMGLCRCCCCGWSTMPVKKRSARVFGSWAGAGEMAPFDWKGLKAEPPSWKLLASRWKVLASRWKVLASRWKVLGSRW